LVGGVAVFCSAVLSKIAFAVPAAPALVSSNKLRLMMLSKSPGLEIIDVRPSANYAAGHIQGAENIPGASLQSAPITGGGPIVVYCDEGVCGLTTGAVQTLNARGYTNVSILDGGFSQWQTLKYPIVKAPLARPVVTQRTADEAAALIAQNQVLALDVRPVTEYAAGHLHNAQNVPLETLNAGMAGLPKGREIMVYDRLSARSKKAALALMAAGYDVTELAGGVAAWTRKKGRAWEVAK
jgi:rhodanese-related sulfurtransferase